MRVPMVGFEADTALRAAFLRLWNRHQCGASHRLGWLRVAIHPRDPNLRLGADLAALLGGMEGRGALVSEVFENGPPEAAPAPRSAPAGSQVPTGEASGVS